MAKRDGDDNLSPEMQAKMQAAKKLQDELNAKLSQFGQIASNKNMSSVKEYDDLEKELLELKKYAASVKNENDAKLNDMINAMNKKMEKMAKTALEEQKEDATRYLELINHINPDLEQLTKVINEFEPGPKKTHFQHKLDQFKFIVEANKTDAEMLIKDANEMAKKMDNANKVRFTKDNLGKKLELAIADVINIKAASSQNNSPEQLSLFN
ncbi:uncharacterized protein LOC106670106 isoform X9 [Cimex lectularius]|uniref:Uncharacterized protein n=1 Tax=Cimex lectularius TaxID=79782 RepID=A0A8I6S9E9_CIMLE|nr:uncharacterized protein LOC106670106 isoform X9 [Cimex lectularius]XP_014255633.1 uncharacterized protein LOC106670106 isoform X9 [Cimex lectularius]